jgi:hypothetical protein
VGGGIAVRFRIRQLKHDTFSITVYHDEYNEWTGHIVRSKGITPTLFVYVGLNQEEPPGYLVGHVQSVFEAADMIARFGHGIEDGRIVCGEEDY